jgi:DNA-directed RNA polymerase
MEEIEALSDTIYLTHRYDRRGRIYCTGYHVNEQGTDYHKAVLEFADKELVE